MQDISGLQAVGLFHNDAGVHQYVLSQADGLYAKQLLRVQNRSFLIRLVSRYLREEAYQQELAAKFNLGDIEDFMG